MNKKSWTPKRSTHCITKGFFADYINLMSTNYDNISIIIGLNNTRFYQSYLGLGTKHSEWLVVINWWFMTKHIIEFLVAPRHILHMNLIRSMKRHCTTSSRSHYWPLEYIHKMNVLQLTESLAIARSSLLWCLFSHPQHRLWMPCGFWWFLFICLLKKCLVATTCLL